MRYYPSARCLYTSEARGTGRWPRSCGHHPHGRRGQGLLDAWASSPASVYFTNFQLQLNWPASPAAEIHPPRLVSSAIVRAAACRQGRNRCPGLRVPRRVVQAGLARALQARVRVHVRGRRPVVVASGLRGFVQTSGTLGSRTGIPPPSAV